ncbi:outer membrane beta-barrel protein [Okeania hirsuta]|uniref:outer membrane beta-barrel protein n=1 Tax=Okeania hirsuta TaxID=1458930 RepID=UPI001375223F|nr:outer membrane beta-barrel protein [Okeania hirsuta]
MISVQISGPASLTAKLKLPAGIDFEATGQYESRQQTVQSLISGNLFMDMEFARRFLKAEL